MLYQAVKTWTLFYTTWRYITAFTRTPMLAPALGQLNPFHALPSYLFRIHINNIFLSTPRSYKWSLSFRFHHKSPEWILLIFLFVFIRSDNKRGKKNLCRTVAVILRIYSVIHFLMHGNFIYQFRSKIFELRKIFEGFITCLYITILSCILFKGH